MSSFDITVQTNLWNNQQLHKPIANTAPVGNTEATGNTAAGNTTTPAANTASSTEMADANLPTPPAGCPKDQDVTQTQSNGRFQPTTDIANKIVTLTTSMGVITLQMYDQDAPKTVENFVCLAATGYYNNTIFHRVVHGFVIQGGDPTGTGMGGQSIYGKSFEDELYSDTPSYKAGYLNGTLAMANTGQPNTNGSQFFILTANTPLPHQYTIFGTVISGLDVVDKIGAVPITPNAQMGDPNDGSPVTPVKLISATVSSSK